MPRLFRRARTTALCIGLAALAAWAEGAASAQGMPDLNLRALDWLRGRWASPVVCERNGEPVETARRLVIAPAPKRVRPASDRITFHGVEIDTATRCSDVLGAAAPDVRGTLVVTLPGMSRPDLAQSEFQRALRQTGGFDFAVVEGRLRMTGWGEGSEPRIVDYAGGVVRVREVRRGSDAARILADMPSPRKLTLELEADDGAERLAFPMVFYDFR
ncbi:MAG TPA: hypothetical protein VKB65_10960 [Myxococcota bacterium]|nr:hypothetical protein [Myxococcota bacterium]